MAEEDDLTIDYVDFPYAPLDGYRGSNNIHLTNALFVETTSTPDIEPLFTIKESAIIHNGRLIPSARLVYIHSDGEWDAMSKIVGSFRQWAKLKELKWFQDLLDLWKAEWYLRQETLARALLFQHAAAKGGASSAKALFDDAKKGGRLPGRPKKAKGKQNEDDAIGADASRIVSLRGSNVIDEG